MSLHLSAAHDCPHHGKKLVQYWYRTVFHEMFREINCVLRTEIVLEHSRGTWWAENYETE
jgi:hypothetical protein